MLLLTAEQILQN